MSVRVYTTSMLVCPAWTSGGSPTTLSSIPTALGRNGPATSAPGGSKALGLSVYPTPTSTLSGSAQVSVGQATSSPTSTNAPDDAFFLIYPFTTTLTIKTFPTPLPAPIATYRPAYSMIDDGSLITPLYIDNARFQSIDIWLVGALSVLFVRNLFTAFTYLKKGHIKNKSLFYTLLLSQLFGPICFLTLSIGIFQRNVDCTPVNIIAAACAQISYALLVTGILGLKAYRCLHRSRIVLAILVTFQVAIFVLFALDIPHMKSKRGLAGTCLLQPGLTYFPISMCLTFAESVFIAACFFFLIWRSTQNITRVSLHSDRASQNEQRRGWWDLTKESPQRKATGETVVATPWWNGIVSKTRRMFNPGGLSAVSLGRKVSTPGPEPLQQPPRLLNHPNEDQAPSRLVPQAQGSNHARRPSKLQRGFSSRTNQSLNGPLGTPSNQLYGPSMVMRTVIRDELFSTALVTLSVVVSAILTMVGAWKSQLLWGPSMSLDVLWALTSLAVMRNYAIVIRRRERDERLRAERVFGQQVSNWRNASTRRPLAPMSDLSSIVFTDPPRERSWLSNSAVGITDYVAEKPDKGKQVDEEKALDDHRDQDPFADFESATVVGSTGMVPKSPWTAFPPDSATTVIGRVYDFPSASLARRGRHPMSDLPESFRQSSRLSQLSRTSQLSGPPSRGSYIAPAASLGTIAPSPPTSPSGDISDLRLALEQFPVSFASSSRQSSSYIPGSSIYSDREDQEKLVTTAEVAK